MLRHFLRSLLRITVAVITAVATLWLCLWASIRQPTIAHVPRYGIVRAQPETLRGDVTFLATRVCPRDVAHPAVLDGAADYVKGRLLECTLRVREEPFLARGRLYRNIIASFGPSRHGESLLVVGAHYDVFASRNDRFPGADDNASGTAGLLELARMLAVQPPAVPVELVAYANEEPPFFGSEEMGSAVHAEALRRSGQQVRAMLCLEMIGYFRGDKQQSPAMLKLLYPAGADFIVVCGRWDDRRLARQIKAGMQSAAAIRVLSFTGPRAFLESSDQISYWNRGYQAVMITDTAYLRNPNYHTTADTPATLDYGRMARVVDGVFNAILAVRSG